MARRSIRRSAMRAGAVVVILAAGTWAHAADATSGPGARVPIAAAADPATAGLEASAVGHAEPASDVRSDARRTGPPPGWSCTPGLCRPPSANPIRSAAAFGVVLAAGGWLARRRAAHGR